MYVSGHTSFDYTTTGLDKKTQPAGLPPSIGLFKFVHNLPRHTPALPLSRSLSRATARLWLGKSLRWTTTSVLSLIGQVKKALAHE